MKLFITAKPGAKDERVEKRDDTHFVVAVKEPPVGGRANSAILKALAGFLRVASSRVKIISGHTGRRKIIEVIDNTS